MFSPTLTFVVAYAALGGFLFGYDLGLIGGALLKIQRYFHVRKSITLELIVGTAKLGAAAGTFLGGAAMARYGRRRALGLTAAAFTAGPLIMAAAAAPWQLMLGRLVVGLGIGMSATVTPAYIAELAPASIRGALVQMYEVMLCIGMLSAPLVDWAISSGGSAGSWRLMVGMPAVAGLALAAAPVVLPESPRWLVTRNRLDEALEVLQVVLTGKAASPSAFSTSLGGSSGMLSLRGLFKALTSGTGADGGYQRVPGKDVPAGGSSSNSAPGGRGGSSSSSGGRGGGSSSRRGGPGPRPAALSAQQQALHDAEDELIALWSSVESDRLAVLERRRQVWLERRQKQGGRRGRLGINWLTALKPPALDSIPEEAHSPTSAASPAPSRASSGVYSGGEGGSGSGSGGGGWGSVALLASSAPREQQREVAGKPNGGGSLGGGAGGGTGFEGRRPGYGSIREAGEEGEEEAELGRGRAGRADCSSSGCIGSARGGGGGPGSSKGGSVATVASALVKSLVSGGGGAAGGGGGAYASLPGREPELAPDPGERSRLLGSPASSSAPGPGRPGGGGGAALAPGEEALAAGDGAADGCGPGGPGPGPDIPGEVDEEEEPGRGGSLAAVLCAMAGDVVALAGGPEARALGLALGLAVLNQANASTAIINYAPSLLQRLSGSSATTSSSGNISPSNSSSISGDGSGDSSSYGSYGDGSSGYEGGDEGYGGAMLYTGLVGVAKLAGVCTALLLVDRCGRRPLLIGGALACGAALVGMTAAAGGGGDPQSRRLLLELCMCGFAFCFSISWAGLFWVVVSELFSMAAKSAAMSAATALLFLTGAVTDLVFLSLEDALGAHVFLLFAGVCVAGAAFVAAALPETKGRTLAEVQALMAVKSSSSGGRSGGSSGRGSAGRGEDGAGGGREGRRWVEMRARGGGP